MNFCKDCVHFRRGGFFYGVSWPDMCHHPQLMFPPDPVRGERIPANPHDERGDDGACGPDAEKFEARPPVHKPRRWWQR